MNFTAIDFETANSARVSACAIGVAVVEDDAVVETFSTLIRPAKLFFSSFNTAIHGIGIEDVMDQPHFFEIWPTIRTMLAGSTVVCHNAGFDMSVLRALLTEYALECEPLEYFCTLQAARNHIADTPNHRLDTLAARFDIALEHHEATSDAVAAAYLAVELAREVGCGTLAELGNIKTFDLRRTASSARRPRRSYLKNR